MSFRKSMNERGTSRAGMLFVVLICAGLTYAGMQVLPFYYYYYELQGLMEAQVRVASDKTEEEIRTNLMRRIEELEIPVRDESSILILKNGKEIYLELDYTEILWFSLGDKDYTIHEFEFLATAGVDPRSRGPN